MARDSMEASQQKEATAEVPLIQNQIKWNDIKQKEEEKEDDDDDGEEDGHGPIMLTCWDR